MTTDPGGNTSEKLTLQATTFRLCEPYRETIELGLSRGRNAVVIWQDLVSQRGFTGGYHTVKRFVRKLRGCQGPQPAGIIDTPDPFSAKAVFARRSHGELPETD